MKPTILLLCLSLAPWVTESAAVNNTTATTTKAPASSGLITNTTLAQEWLKEYNSQAQIVYNHREIAAWKYESNLTDHNKKLSIQASIEKDNFKVEAKKNASQFDWESFTDDDLRRKFQKISDVGTSALPDKTKLMRLNQLVADMQSIYSKAKVCLTGGSCEHLEPGLTELFAKNRDYETLLTAWKTWRDVTGKQMKPLYAEFVQLSNEASRISGHNDTGEYWRSFYEDPNFRQELEDLYKQIKPLYENLHIYIRRKLKQTYGADKFPKSGHIPAHLLGNMWAQQWDNILDVVLPYPNKQSVDVTPEMIKQNYTSLKMFETAESFFTSLGLKKMREEFWNRSIIERPGDGRPLTCHASAWDFFDGKDFRIKMCTRVNMEDLITIHHEMGHIQYFMQYSDQPLIYRDGANPGFHEAVGDTLALSVGTTTHLNTLHLLNKLPSFADKEFPINHLMKIALEKIAFLPFGYLIDLYRWDVFSGVTAESQYNKHWWGLRCKYQGLSPPVWRSDDDFDPGAKFHVAANVPYIRYFVSFIVQFQFHKALCDEAGQAGLPLHQCDIYNSTKAGTLLSKMLKMGSSKPWPEAMNVITKQRKIDATALMEYFQPLTEYLKKENNDSNDTVGWTDNCPTLDEEERAQEWLHNTYEPLAELNSYNEAVADWNYDTNLTKHNQAITLQMNLAYTAFAKEAAKNASSFEWKNFRNPDTRRQMESVTDLGIYALDNTTKLKRLSELTSQMEGMYSKGEVCLEKDRCLEIEPDLTRLMASSRDYHELAKAWEGWRNVTGKLMKPLYEEFVDLSNEAARASGIYNDTGVAWRSAYGKNDTLADDLEEQFKKVRPFYEQLQAYVRGKLRQVYGKALFPTSGHIPAHLLGNMWAQQWNNIYDIVKPYKDQPAIDVTPELKKQKFTALRMFKTSEEFYKSIGLLPMPETFWNDSMITKPTDGRKVVCHASAWDFSNRHDYRIKMCTDITMEDLIVIHHEMGHIQYYLQYKDLPITYRTGANPGFHEAVGDTLALSVSTPGHLRKIGLLTSSNTSYESTINFLLKIALEKIAFLPFGYLIDQWRWSVFSGETQPRDYNEKWWDLRCKYQGVSPPVTRHETDFDPGAKYHVASNTPYIRYFVSFIVQFQFHKALCDAAGHKGPLHECDIYRSKEAGTLLSDMLKMGASKPWPDAMYRITGQREMDAGALMEYFQPLIDWLKEQNVNENLGWSTKCPPPPDSIPKNTCMRANKRTGSSPRLTVTSHVVFLSIALGWLLNCR
ncbi:angiotensin-converting enzyme-like [Liolophura sinensis]|uniref:angiotensin-converting enzyme-like n=1 Tax=Liolophura sinensis TaxID=3198878 RepID=UPI00315856AB